MAASNRSLNGAEGPPDEFNPAPGTRTTAMEGTFSREYVVFLVIKSTVRRSIPIKKKPPQNRMVKKRNNLFMS
jgi:hypothetical protein